MSAVLYYSKIRSYRSCFIFQKQQTQYKNKNSIKQCNTKEIHKSLLKNQIYPFFHLKDLEYLLIYLSLSFTLINSQSIILILNIKYNKTICFINFVVKEGFISFFWFFLSLLLLVSSFYLKHSALAVEDISI